jgi:cupin fold WbuC family metalloprotein
MNYKRINEEVFVADEKYSLINRTFITTLKNYSVKNKRKRVRICIHNTDKELVQEMFIVHMKDCYVRPHKHLNKDESLFLLEGNADVIIFNENGEIEKTMHMGDYTSGKDFYYHIGKSVYHSLIIFKK